MTGPIKVNTLNPNARVGQYLRCDVFGRYLETLNTLHSGTGLIYQVLPDGMLRRVIY